MTKCLVITRYMVSSLCKALCDFSFKKIRILKLLDFTPKCFSSNEQEFYGMSFIENSLVIILGMFEA